MDPTILKSLQKIEELVKNKKNIIEQIPIKSSIDAPPPVVLPKIPPTTQGFPLQNIPGPIPILKNLMPNAFHNEQQQAMFMNPMNVPPNMNMNMLSFNDGIIIPPQNEPLMPFFPENDKLANTQKNSLTKPTKNQYSGDVAKKKNPLEKEQSAKEKKKKMKTLRKIAGETWEDKSLEEWPENDFRIFCGDLGNEVNDEVLATAFRKYSSFQRARVIRDKRSGKTKGYGFVSLMDPQEYLRALNEMNGKYVGNRPIKIRKSSWKDRALVGGKFSENKGKKKLKIH